MDDGAEADTIFRNIIMDTSASTMTNRVFINTNIIISRVNITIIQENKSLCRTSSPTPPSTTSALHHHHHQLYPHHCVSRIVPRPPQYDHGRTSGLEGRSQNESKAFEPSPTSSSAMPFQRRGHLWQKLSSSLTGLVVRQGRQQ